MHIETLTSLKAYNTFGIDCKAQFFTSVETLKDLKEVLSKEIHPNLFVLGGGSNLLLTKDVNALVLHINMKGITLLSKENDHVLLEVNAGENWHDFVLYCIENDYGGIENLSLIPGNVGTAPIQNIGAYGVELKDVFVRCHAIRISTQEEVSFDHYECQFGYRNSIFKNEAKDEYIITSVVFKLSTKNHIIKSSYGAIQEQLKKSSVSTPTISDISKAVIAIRQSKLPDPAKIGNSGSFFKNPVISTEAFQEFRMKFPRAPFYEVSATEFKIPAGWLIEQAGFKGKRFGEAGVHKNQALVIVNHGKATGTEIWELALKIQKKVKEDFGIYIEPEVNVI
ncbi:MAG: UDP-N-acetylmuramate dehydrogenase [Bacteroidetes bacterium]|nr:UDP-N-acetylmuramate dehydrogenase [Bacteroidota bacterium]